MNREEAIKFFELQTQDEQALIDGINLNPDDFVFGAEGPEQYINDCQNNIDAYNTAITALREPQWVKTSERLPTLKDAPNGRVVNAWSYAPMSGEYGLMVGNLEDVEATANPKDYWMPLPPLPEVEE